MLIRAEAFSGTSQGSQPSTEISFRLPLNCEQQFLWFKGSHLYYFSCLSLFLKASGMVRWFWCVSPLSLHPSCVAHFLHSIWHSSHPLSSPVSWSFTLGLWIAAALQRGFVSHPGGKQGQLLTTLQSCFCSSTSLALLTRAANAGITKALILKAVFPYHHSRLSERWIKIWLLFIYLLKFLGFKQSTYKKGNWEEK